MPIHSLIRSADMLRTLRHNIYKWLKFSHFRGPYDCHRVSSSGSALHASVALPLCTPLLPAARTSAGKHRKQRS